MSVVRLSFIFHRPNSFPFMAICFCFLFVMGIRLVNILSHSNLSPLFLFVYAKVPILSKDHAPD